MKRVTRVLLIALAVAHQASAQTVDKDKLRQLVEVPTVNLTFGFGYFSDKGFSRFANVSAYGVEALSSCSNDQGTDVATRVAATLKLLKGNASDADVWRRLGSLYTEAYDSAHAGQAYTNALNLCRQQAKSSPADGAVLARYGRALMNVGQRDQAETVLRQAVKVAPTNWNAWAGLGACLSARATTALLGPQADALNGDFVAQVTTLAAQNQPSLDQIGAAKRLLSEASDCYDQAVAVAPNEPEAHIQRWLFRAFTRNALERGAIAGQADWFRATCAPEVIPDLWQTARLLPDNPDVLSLAAGWEIMSYVIYNGVQHPEATIWGQLPDKSKQLVTDAMKRLQTIANGADRSKAAAALEALGTIEEVFQNDNVAAERSLRRAVTLDPSRDQAWDLLMLATASLGHTNDTLAVCEQRLQINDCVRNRFLLARACVKFNQTAKGEEQLQVILKQDPNNFLANLSWAAVLLRQGDDAATLGRAHELIGKAIQTALASTNAQEFAEAATTAAIGAGLAGNSEAAKRSVAEALKADPDNKQAAEVSKVLGQ
jgi:tetratricopeptide (TPR) repeat protein